MKHTFASVYVAVLMQIFILLCFTGALSNIPQFFQHLRSNLEALQLDEEDEESEEADSGKYERPLGQPGDAMLYYGNEDEGRAPIIPHLPGKKSFQISCLMSTRFSLLNKSLFN